jgi:hypothetical protein
VFGAHNLKVIAAVYTTNSRLTRQPWTSLCPSLCTVTPHLTNPPTMDASQMEMVYATGEIDFCENRLIVLFWWLVVANPPSMDASQMGWVAGAAAEEEAHVCQVTQTFRRSPPRPLRPIVVNTVGLTTQFSGRYPIDVCQVASLSLTWIPPSSETTPPLRPHSRPMPRALGWS